MRNTHSFGFSGLPTTYSAPTFGVSAPCYEPPDAGVGSGGAPSSSGSADGAGAGSGGVGDGGAGGSGAPSTYKLTDDSLVDFGDGKPVKWGEARTSRYMDRASYDRGVDFLMQRARELDAQRGQGRQGQQRQGQQQQQQQGQQPPADPFANIEDLAVVDGRTLAKLGRQMQQQGFGPIGQLVTQLAGRLQTLEGQVTRQGQLTGTLAEQQTSQEFENFVTTALTGVPEIKGLGTIDPKNDTIREIAKDIFLSHDQTDKSLQREFPKMLETRLNDLFKLFTKMQGDAVETARQNRRKFFQPGAGAAKPGGGDAFKFRSGAELAREFFGSEQART